MSSENINQVYIANPITSNASTDLMYFGQSPYTSGDDAAMTYANFAAQFGAPFTPAALTKTNDTNVTLTLGGTPATSLLESVSLTLGWTGTLALAKGGSAANLTASNGGIVYSTASAMAILAGTATANLPLLSGSSTTPSWGSYVLSLGGALMTAGALTLSGAYASTFTFTNTTSVTFPTSGTLATTSQIPTPAALTESNDTNVTLTLGGTPATSLLQAVSITAGWTGTLALARGGFGASLSSVNSAVFSTTSGGVSQLSTTLPTGLTIPGFAKSGANSDITSMTGLTGLLQHPTGISDPNGNNIVLFNYVASAVNYLAFTNNVTTEYPVIQAEGTDSTVGINLITKHADLWFYDGTNTAAPAIRFYNTAATFYTGLKAGANTGNVTFALPIADGTNGQVIQTNGSGVLSFASASGSGITNGGLNAASQFLLSTSTTAAASTTAFSWDSVNANLLFCSPTVSGGTPTNCIAIGGSIVGGGSDSSITIGFLNSNQNNKSIAIGYGISVTGNSGIAIGFGAYAPAFACVGIGINARPTNSGSWVITDSNEAGQTDNAADQFVAGFNGGYRFFIGTASTPAVAVNINASGELISLKGRADQSYSLQTPSTGFTITIAANVQTLILNPAGTLASGTINLPASPIDGQEVRVTTSQIITTLTVSGNGHTIINAPTTLALGTGFAYIYNLSGTTWYRLY